ncbi:MAG: outer membrane protein transport protein [Gammaproteobacteria bacterium]|nr:outer membrane protein transport protein [Gammaproteobacteria bacterium]MCP5406097.1 outer membrane protein transport protein [Chromatiaceae bacterium]MCP5408692.1 outer membrane protein transport protein [Chromatiaceae bacterium]MCP5442655.1 outer membrane protein transport protein [Chromatiaceae bacterium]
MNKRFRWFVVVAFVLFSASVSATNGYWSHGYGPKSKSIAGACVAMVFGAMCAASNPGSLALVGDRLEFGAALFAPKRGFVADDNALGPPIGSIPPGDYESDNDIFLIPHFAYNRMLDEKSSIGIAIGGNGGMNTEYDSAVFQRFANPGDPTTTPSSPTGIDMKQAFVGLTYSRRLNDEHSIGIEPIFAIQSFKAEGLQPFQPYSESDTKVTNNGTDISYGGGLRLGWLWQVNDRLNIGASYQSRLYMTEFDDYAGLFAEQGDFDIPSNFDLGFSYKFTPEVTFAFNYQRINFAEVATIGNRSDVLFVPGGEPELGCNKCMGFGWDDVNIYKFGVQWQYQPDLAFRAGYSYATDVFKGSQALFNVLAPAVVKRHFSFGLGKKLEGGSEINLAFTYMPEEKVYGTNPNTGGITGQTGHVYMDQWELEIGWATAF